MTDRDRLIELCVEFKHKECEDLTYCDIDLLADYLIANGVTVGKDTNVPTEWISVEDRLPEKGERVLASDGAFVGEFYLDAKSRWKRYNVNEHRLDLVLDITHWQPLPQPPKEVE